MAVSVEVQEILDPTTGDCKPFRYNAYICDQPIAQEAIDVLFICKEQDEKTSVLVSKRGNETNVDMQMKFIPGGGEHREPKPIDGVMKKIGFKSDIMRTINEEGGVLENYLKNSYIFELGCFNKFKRDPRYAKFSINRPLENNLVLEFGMDRDSWTDVFLIYLELDKREKLESITSVGSDKTEIVKSEWWPTDTAISEEKRLVWMIPEHREYIFKALQLIANPDRTDWIMWAPEEPKDVAGGASLKPAGETIEPVTTNDPSAQTVEKTDKNPSPKESDATDASETSPKAMGVSETPPKKSDATDASETSPNAQMIAKKLKFYKKK